MLLSFSSQHFLSIYRTAYISRLIDEAAQRYCAYMQRGVIFSGIGAELGASIVTSFLRRTDFLVPRYRGFTAITGKGLSPYKIFSEIMRKRDGAAHGLGDSSPFRDLTCGISGYSTILGANFSIATGIALSIKLAHRDAIVVIFFGDGESTRSTFGSALNLAKLWHLPLLFVCENNGISYSTPLSAISSTQTIANRAQGFEISYLTLQETGDLGHVAAVQHAIASVRKTQKPFLLEFRSRRFSPHFSGMKIPPFFASSIPEREDPMLRFKKNLIAHSICSASSLERLEQSLEQNVKKDYKKAEASQQCSESLFWNIYHE